MMTNKEKYKKTFDVLAAFGQDHLEELRMKKTKKRRSFGRNAVSVAAAMVILAAGGTGVYAALHHYGILDFSGRATINIPAEAESQIQKDINAVPIHEEQVENSVISISVKEALCDSATISLVYEVAAKETGKYLLIPEDAEPADNMSNWSNIENQTAQEYADENNLTILNVGGGISNRDALGIAVETIDFQSVSDEIMDVFVTCGKADSGSTLDIEVVATTRIAGEDDVQRLDAVFTLQDLSSTENMTYMLKSSDVSEELLVVEKAEVTQTDLGTYVEIYYEADSERNLWFHVLDAGGNEVQTVGSSYVEELEDGYVMKINLEKTGFEEELNLKVYDSQLKNVYGIIHLGLDRR